VQYVVEGSVRRAGNRFRITAQLIDAAAGNHLWAERYDREMEDIFAVQDDVTRQIVTNIAPRLQLEDQHSATRRAPQDMRAYDHYLQAKKLVDIPSDVADLRLAREHCDRAIEINPGYARAHAYKAMSYVIGIPMMETEDPEDWQRHALTCAERAVALDDLDNVSHWALGEAAFWAKQPERALRHIKRAIALNPNDADVLAISSYFEAAVGDPDLATRHLAMAFERNPTNPNWYHWVAGTTMAFLGRFAEALAEYDLCDPPNLDVLKLRTIALVQLGRLDEARAQVRTMLAIMPELTIAILRKRDMLLPDADMRTESLRLAGVPE
jgi:tetratricopeptide (TPR) repeat protein